MKKERFTVHVDDIPIAGQLMTPDNGAAALVVLCHGAPSGRPPQPGDGGYPALAERFCGEGYAACCFNFRGTGESGGNIDFFGWTRDLRHVLDFLLQKPELTDSGVFLVGFSAGAGISVYTAARDSRINGVAACACPADLNLFKQQGRQEILASYRDIGAMRDDNFPPSIDEWFDGLDKIFPEEQVARISPRPLLLLHGDADTIVPVDHAGRMYAAAGEPKELVILQGAGHRLRQEEPAVQTVLAWLKSHDGPDTAQLTI